jgi:hypothetical protein
MYQAQLAVSSHASVGGGNLKATVQSSSVQRAAGAGDRKLAPFLIKEPTLSSGAFADQHLTTEADDHESNIDSVAPLSGRLIGEFRGVFLSLQCNLHQSGLSISQSFHATPKRASNRPSRPDIISRALGGAAPTLRPRVR